MPVSTFECQIVRGQIGRYLDGGVLSPVALAGLEEHLAECADCKATVAERRAALLGSLGRPTHAVVSMPVENPLVAALRARAAADEVESVEPEPVATPKAVPRYAKSTLARGNLTKPLALAGLLAVVLLGMGRLSRTVTAPNAKASAAFAAESLPERPRAMPVRRLPAKAIPAKPGANPTVAKPISVKPVPPVPAKGSLNELFVSKPPANPDARESVPVPVPKKRPPALPAKPVVRVTRRPSASISRIRPAKARRVASPRRTPHRSKVRKAVARRSTVRVYGLDGRPLKP